MDDLISRQDALTEIRKDGKWLEEQGVTSMTTHERELRDTFILREMPSAQRWIPVKWKPLNDLEREEWEDQLGYKLSDEEVKFGEADFKLPDDGDDIWVCTKSGIVDGDIFYNDNGMITLEYADITDIVAWMPKTEPEPYKGENQ